MCVAGSSIGDRHTSRPAGELLITCVGMDYGFLGSREEGTSILCAKDALQRWYFALPVPQKGLDAWAAGELARQVAESGHLRLCLKSDSEAPILAFKESVAATLRGKHGVEVVPEAAYKDS